MLTIVVMIVVLAALACVVVLSGMRYLAIRKKYSPEERELMVFFIGDVFFASLLVSTISAGVCAGIIADQYNTVLALPIDLAAITRTISEQEAYVIGQGANIGSGLEGVEIKTEIARNVSKRNELIARIEYINVSPWWVFKVRLDGSVQSKGDR
ncbi:MAG: hypothetical protein PHZ19_11315 [Candidatus Thermoplasmatota archaeon]|nr:hypothetical protein [Candidatus Thermoplasmatota archaeon]